MAETPRKEAFVAERISLPGSGCQHAVIFDREGAAVEVRSYPGAEWKKEGPARPETAGGTAGG